jgi:DNA-binding MarR family transcriptional regulator
MQLLQDASIAGATLADCARELLDVIPAVIRPIRQQMRSHRTHGLSVPQFRALCFVERYDGSSLSEVAEHLDLSLPAVSRMVNGLVERGFMQRRASSDDRRHVSLSVSSRGHAVMGSARKATQRYLAERMEQLSSNELSAVAESMRVLRQVFEQEMPRPARD